MADAPLTLADLAQIDIANMKGVGDKRRAALVEFGIENVLDLLTTYPRRYVDRTNEAHVTEIVEGVETWCSSKCATCAACRFVPGAAW